MERQSVGPVRLIDPVRQIEAWSCTALMALIVVGTLIGGAVPVAIGLFPFAWVFFNATRPTLVHGDRVRVPRRVRPPRIMRSTDVRAVHVGPGLNLTPFLVTTAGEEFPLVWFVMLLPSVPSASRAPMLTAQLRRALGL